MTAVEVGQWAAWSIAALSLGLNFYTVAVEQDRRKQQLRPLIAEFWTAAVVLAAAVGVAATLLRDHGVGLAAASLVLIAAIAVAIRSTRYLRLFGRTITIEDK